MYENIENTFTDLKFAVLDYFRSQYIAGIAFELKDKREIVTMVDRAVDSIIISRIMKDFPHHRIVSEESGVTGGGGDWVWYIDPVDNTVGLVGGERDISTSIALKMGERHIRSMVLNPRTGEVFEADEKESFMNGKKLKTCQGSLFDKARGISTCAYVTKTRIDQARQIIGRIYENRLPLRVSGGSALDLCFVAEGRHIAHVSLGAHTWDVEAGIHMVRKAGGVVETFNHNSRTSSMGMVAASGEAVLNELKSLLGDIIIEWGSGIPEKVR